MPKGVKKGDRRGRYNKLGSGVDQAPVVSGHVDPWTDEDREHYRELLADSPLTSERTKAGAARRAVEADRQCRALDAMSRTADDDANLSKAQTQYRKMLELLRVAERVKEDEEDL